MKLVCRMDLQNRQKWNEITLAVERNEAVSRNTMMEVFLQSGLKTVESFVGNSRASAQKHFAKATSSSRDS